MSPNDPLKLVALDEDDLKIVSAHVQDAVLKVADINWSPSAGTFIAPMNRFAWEEAQRPRQKSANERRRSVLHFDRVKRVQSIGVAPGDKQAVLAVLAVVFEPTDPPAGVIDIVCSGDVTLRLEVEYIEARLTDLGSAWGASMRPKHRLGRG